MEIAKHFEQPADIELSVQEPAPRSNRFSELVLFFTDPLAMLAAAVFVVILLAAILAPWIAPQDPYDLATLSILDAGLPPGSESLSGGSFILGSDPQGRDMLSAMLYGLRVSLVIPFVSITVAVTVGTAIGLVAAYFGRHADAILMRVVDFQLGFPPILLALVILALLGQGVEKTAFALAAAYWAIFARLVRGVALGERQREYVLAAQCLAIPDRRIILRHLLPNVIPPLVTVATLEWGACVALEATLSFLGLGVPITRPSLGMLIANGFEYVLTGRYWISLFPGIVLMVLVLSINLLGDRLRDVLSPRFPK